MEQLQRPWPYGVGHIHYNEKTRPEVVQPRKVCASNDRMLMEGLRPSGVPLVGGMVALCAPKQTAKRSRGGEGTRIQSSPSWYLDRASARTLCLRGIHSIQS